jgi:hypothetical protein
MGSPKLNTDRAATTCRRSRSSQLRPMRRGVTRLTPFCTPGEKENGLPSRNVSLFLGLSDTLAENVLPTLR